MHHIIIQTPSLLLLFSVNKEFGRENTFFVRSYDEILVF